MTRPRLLLSGRDVGAGLSVAEFARFATESGQLEVVFVAQDPLLSLVRKVQPGVIACELPGVDSGEGKTAEELRVAARDLLRAHEPDALLVSLSGPGAGIDEALLSEARSVPRYAFQDYWGDVNAGFGAIADCFFVLDDEAARITRQRCGQPCVVVGSPKHARYDSLDVQALRQGWRAAQDMVDGEAAVVFFGQPFWQIGGYAETLDCLANELRGLAPKARLYYRPHPKEDAESALAYLQRLRESGFDARREANAQLESILAGADLVVSCFSTVGYDLLMLNRRAPEPLAVPLYLLFDPCLRDWYEARSSLESLPLSEQDLALLCASPKDLGRLLTTALTPSTRETIWQSAAASLPDPAGASERMMQKLLSDLSGASGMSSVRARPLAG